jgi:hypothetical protein
MAIQGQSIDRALTAMVALSLCITGGLTAASLSLSFVFGPSAIARGEHLAALGVSLGPCSGCGMCGMSRAFSCFSHGEFARAFEFNPGVVVLWPLFLAMTLACAWAVFHLFRHPLRTQRPVPAHP